jgi:hypothetical protein
MHKVKAFPSVEPVYRDQVVGVKETPGMDIRDFFAIQIFKSLLPSNLDGTNIMETAEKAYYLADVLFEARNK